jgi:hypothetical protein
VIVLTVVLVVLPSPNFQVYEVKVPEPPEAVAVKLAGTPTSVGLGLIDVISTVSPTAGLTVSMTVLADEVAPTVSVAFTLAVNVV